MLLVFPPFALAAFAAGAFNWLADVTNPETGRWRVIEVAAYVVMSALFVFGVVDLTRRHHRAHLSKDQVALLDPGDRLRPRVRSRPWRRCSISSSSVAGRRAQSSRRGSPRIPACTVALVEAGGPPPPAESMPAACPALQLNPETDWMYTADAGNAGLGLADGRMMVPARQDARRLLGHQLHGLRPWASRGLRRVGRGWRDGLELRRRSWPYFKKSEGLAPSGDIVVDTDAHNTEGPLGVSVRAPVLRGAQEFVDAAVAAGIPMR